MIATATVGTAAEDTVAGAKGMEKPLVRLERCAVPRRRSRCKKDGEATREITTGHSNSPAPVLYTYEGSVPQFLPKYQRFGECTRCNFAGKSPSPPPFPHFFLYISPDVVVQSASGFGHSIALCHIVRMVHFLPLKRLKRFLETILAYCSVSNF